MTPELLITLPTGETHRLPLILNRLTIGRAPICGLSFPENSSLSRQHASIERDGDAWFIVDLGSRNGTFLNGVPARGPMPLTDYDRIQVGNIVIVFGTQREPSSLPVARAEPTRPKNSGQPVLVFKGQHLRIALSDATPFTFGRTSTLFRAATESHGDVCVKLFPQVKGIGWEGLANFEREVMAQTALKHRNILPVLDYGTQSEPHGSPFVVLPYCDGGSMRTLLRERSFYSLAAVQDILQQTASALDAAHADGVIHGDVKPENILLARSRTQAYLSDFGMSNVFAIHERFTTRVPGDPGGTTAYLSPEQIAESQQTAFSDIYAFAIVAYELLTGHLPFDQQLPPFRQMAAKVEGKVLDPRRFSPLITDEMTQALLVALDRDPLKRPRSAAKFCQLLSNPKHTSLTNEVVSGSQLKRVFISYSHYDAPWLERVRVHLRPLERQYQIDCWDDTHIDPGQNWREELQESLETASCAILLVSPHFLASDFCTLQEVPQLLRRALDRGIIILPLLLSPCRFQGWAELSKLQSVNPPSRTLAEMSSPECDRVLMRLADAVRQALAKDM
jgi:serine/threonine protein kinase